MRRLQKPWYRHFNQTVVCFRLCTTNRKQQFTGCDQLEAYLMPNDLTKCGQCGVTTCCALCREFRRRETPSERLYDIEVTTRANYSIKVLVYVNDLPGLVKDVHEILLFADDTSLSFKVRRQQPAYDDVNNAISECQASIALPLTLIVREEPPRSHGWAGASTATRSRALTGPLRTVHAMAMSGPTSRHAPPKHKAPAEWRWRPARPIGVPDRFNYATGARPPQLRHNTLMYSRWGGDAPPDVRAALGRLTNRETVICYLNDA
ncbi:hypothetical protein EVAR_96192_1 [Eumeta japonica]|uniref:Uncharacterized protein n=1 Tax=Eumeta variegata TaxID=151549 RepID=A0A4C1VJ28_EUMVA|nr:hypothetical protein EVAR_96192_1 [Eumeta japonica]